MNFKQSELGSHETTQILGTSIIIELHHVFDFTVLILLTTVKEHDDAQLISSDYKIKVLCKLSSNSCVTHRVAPLQLSVIVLLSVVAVEVFHFYVDLKRNLDLESFVGWPITCCQNCNIKFDFLA